MADTATVAGGVIAVGGVIVTSLKLWIERDLKQLRHNGGSHVADYARDARDNSQKALEMIGEHLVQSARKEGEQDAKLAILLDRLR
jgi:hypothetical protein